MRFFFTELSSVNTYFVLLSEGNRRGVEAVLRQVIFILTLLATFCLLFFSYFLCIKQFACLNQRNKIFCEAVTSHRQCKQQNLFVWLQMTDLGECSSSEMKQCAGVTVDYEQNPFFFPSPKCSSFSKSPFFVELCAEAQNGVKNSRLCLL